MIKQFTDFIDSKLAGAKPLLIVIRGSQAYGTNIETSDTDFSGVYVQSLEDIFGNKYTPQINDDKNDTVFYELRRFLDLLSSNNPGILELLNTPDHCIIYKHELFDEILSHKNEFLTKQCKNSFAGYAKQQVIKSKGQDKKQNWSNAKVERKTPLDFCYIHIGEYSISLTEYLDSKSLKQEFCGLSKMPHSRDTYSLFYDNDGLGFRGISFEDSNEVRLSSIPSGQEKNFIGHISYNKDSYTSHCKDYNSYKTWLENKNNQRWVDVKSHGQKIDGKNLMHCVRIIRMAKEIARGEGVKIFRDDSKYLLSIRRGDIDLQTLIDEVERDIDEISELFEKSDLPKSIDNELINNLLINTRKKFYNI
jgi:hypothetical protein